MITESQLDVLLAVVDLRDQAQEFHVAVTDAADLAAGELGANTIVAHNLRAYGSLTRDLSAIASHLLDTHLLQLDGATRKIVEATYRVRAERVDGDS